MSYNAIPWHQSKTWQPRRSVARAWYHSLLITDMPLTMNTTTPYGPPCDAGRATLFIRKRHLTHPRLLCPAAVIRYGSFPEPLTSRVAKNAERVPYPVFCTLFPVHRIEKCELDLELQVVSGGQSISGSLITCLLVSHCLFQTFSKRLDHSVPYDWIILTRFVVKLQCFFD